MNNSVYISNFSAESGISKYSNDFYRLVLQESGYQKLDSNQPLDSILTHVRSSDRVHLELGLFQAQEIEILLAMVRGKYKNLTVTLHDPPLIRYPFHTFHNPLLNNLSKIADRLGLTIRSTANILSKLERVYVLSDSSRTILENRLKLSNVSYMPHVVDPLEIVSTPKKGNDLIYFGFIGPNKGVDYALELHQNLLKSHPELIIHVVGKHIGRNSEYVDQIKKKYNRNVHFTGYLSEQQLRIIFSKTSYSLLPIRDYGFYIPFSASILQSMKYGNVIFTRKSNAIHETIKEGSTGLYLEGIISRDTKKLNSLLTDSDLTEQISRRSQEFVKLFHSPALVLEHFKPH